MPFVGLEHWTEQFFAGQPVPDDVSIPVSDVEAWQLYPEHRWVYNKLLICETQGLPHGPMGTRPPGYPVFSKPIYNLCGMGWGARILRAESDPGQYEPGYFWMPVLAGRHVSSDVALADGRPVWWRHTTATPAPRGTFDHWTVHAARDPALEADLGPWIARHLRRFTGVVNFETIGGRIIECHLRMADQWADLNGPGWLAAVAGLYAHGTWRFADERRDGYSVVWFDPRVTRRSFDPAAVERLARRTHVTSIQVTFYPDYEPDVHAMPPGGMRLAIVNAWDLEAGRAVREELRQVIVPIDAAAAD